ncbi:MAG TPA: amylo-alpha-1,6-glucosidase [Ilumatobacteraceae bacterium]|nr:amylo-alpha-1,6-glucosidase [Ilumatobacteraceae bacterium]
MSRIASSAHSSRMDIRFGPQVCGALDSASAREWLVTDGLGGFAMGTVGGLRTRRYHGLLVVATDPPIGRRLGLAALDPVLVVAGRRYELATREWASGEVAPHGYRYLTSFELVEGVPRWRWQVGDVVLEAEVAMVHGRPATGVVHRVVSAPAPVQLELAAVATWRDVHGERFASGDVPVEPNTTGFVFDDAYQVRGPGYRPATAWWHGSHQREEAARGLQPNEDLCHAGTFVLDVHPGEHIGIEAWAGEGDVPPAVEIVAAARKRYRSVCRTAKATSPTDRALAHAADQFIVAGPTVVAGYPWFGDWSRDTFTSYEGLFLCTGRHAEGAQLLRRAASTVSEGMLANTSDVGGHAEYNTADATMWFLHAVARHVEATGDHGLAADLAPTLTSIVDHHVAGTRYGIGVDPADGLVTQGQDGLALTWMDARVDGMAVTARTGKTVEINALWISALRRLADIADKVGVDGTQWRSLADRADTSFGQHFITDAGSLRDTVDDPTLRPNQVIAASLPAGPVDDETRTAVLDSVASLLTPLGLRSLDPDDHRYHGEHRGDSAARDTAYHQGSVWPWLIGPYAEAARRAGRSIDGLLEGIEAHLAEFGLGSVSETADGDAPHTATGCPFQAWSVAELNRVRQLARLSSPASERRRAPGGSNR